MKNFIKIGKIIIAIPLAFLALWIALLSLYVVVLLAAGLVGGVHEYFFGRESDRKVNTHVTIYVSRALQQEGGAVVVSGIPVNPQAWLDIQNAAKHSTANLAMLDPQNPKAAQVKAVDQHMGVMVSSAVSIVEIYYPQDGAYTYNFLSLPNTVTTATATAATTLNLPAPAQVQTKVVTSGSVTSLRDPETGGTIDWPFSTVVAVAGAKHSEDWARSVGNQFSRVESNEFSQVYKITKVPAVRVMEVTAFGMKKYYSSDL
jgi:hypothetical protein